MSESPLWDWVDVAEWLHRKGQVHADVVADACISRRVNLLVQKNYPSPDIDDEIARLFA
jgi:hypothetical protein